MLWSHFDHIMAVLCNDGSQPCSARCCGFHLAYSSTGLGPPCPCAASLMLLHKRWPDVASKTVGTLIKHVKASAGVDNITLMLSYCQQHIEHDPCTSNHCYVVLFVSGGICRSHWTQHSSIHTSAPAAGSDSSSSSSSSSTAGGSHSKGAAWREQQYKKRLHAYKSRLPRARK